ncbi:MAG: hypothetical protein JXA87_13900 [Thermoleophilia bacterium]|nr:hypothetical protein [Thermoleophilia bacterium]
MRPLKIVSIVVGAILVLIGLGLIVPGGLLLWAHGTQRDDSGFFESSSRVMSTNGYAIATPDIDLHIGSDIGWVPKGATLAVRIRAVSTSGDDLFVAMGPTDQISQYLGSVERDEVTDFGWFSAAIDYLHIDGGAPSSPPGGQDFWVARQVGPGTQTLEWEVQQGNWTAVIMNADGSADVNASVSLGARFGLLLPIGIGFLVAGIVLFAIGVVLIVLGARPSRPTEAVPTYAPASQPQMPYPPGQMPQSGIPYGAPIPPQPSVSPPRQPPEPPQQGQG